jgi:isoleucyl-tRNA synthetase
VRAPDEASSNALDVHREQILEELNVKNIEFIARDDVHVNYNIKPNLPVLGKRLGKEIPQIRAALKDFPGAEIASNVARGASTVISIASGSLSLAPEELLVETSAIEGYACAEDSGFLTELDTTLNDELINEGFARELVRSVQDARKQAGLEVSDRITLGVAGSPAVETAIAAHRDYIMSETLAIAWQVGQSKPLFSANRELGEDQWSIEISRQAVD